jgi:virginiamycin B lyase
MAPNETFFEYDVVDAIDVTVTPDGSAWFSLVNSSQLARVQLDGTIEHFDIPLPNSHPVGVAAAANGDVWFTDKGANEVVRFSLSGH